MDEYSNPWESKEFIPNFCFKPGNNYKTKTEDGNNYKTITEKWLVPPKQNSFLDETQVGDSTTKHNVRGQSYNLQMEEKEGILDILLTRLKKNVEDINQLIDRYQHLREENKRLRMLSSCNSNFETTLKTDNQVVSTEQPCQANRGSKHHCLNTLKQSNPDLTYYEESRRFKRGLKLIGERIQHYRLNPTENVTVETRITIGESCPCIGKGDINHNLINAYPHQTNKQSSAKDTHITEKLNERNHSIYNGKNLKNCRNISGLQELSSKERPVTLYSNTIPPNDELDFSSRLENMTLHTDNENTELVRPSPSMGTWEGRNTPKPSDLTPLHQYSKACDNKLTDYISLSKNNRYLGGTLKRINQHCPYPSKFKNDRRDMRLLRHAQLPDNSEKFGSIQNSEVNAPHVPFRLQTYEKRQTARASETTHSTYELINNKPYYYNMDFQKDANIDGVYVNIARTRQGREHYIEDATLYRRNIQKMFKSKARGNREFIYKKAEINRNNTVDRRTYFRRKRFVRHIKGTQHRDTMMKKEDQHANARLSKTTENPPTLKYMGISSDISENLSSRMSVMTNNNSSLNDTSLQFATTKTSDENPSMANSDLKYPETTECCIM